LKRKSEPGIFLSADRALVWVQMPVRLDTHSEPQPDLMLLRRRADFYASGHPEPEDVLLIIEVADASLAYDRDTKMPLYARHGIPEAWLIDVENKHMAIYREPEGGPTAKSSSPCR